MEPYVPSQGPAKWLSYLDYLAGTSTWVKGVQPEHWKVVFSGRVVCSPRLSVAVVRGQQLICKRCVKHQIKCKLKVEYPVWRTEGVLWVCCEPLGCTVWELLSLWPTDRGRWVTFFARDFFRSVLQSSSGEPELWFQLLWKSRSTHISPVSAPVKLSFLWRWSPPSTRTI